MKAVVKYRLGIFQNFQLLTITFGLTQAEENSKEQNLAV